MCKFWLHKDVPRPEATRGGPEGGPEGAPSSGGGGRVGGVEGGMQALTGKLF